MISGFERLSVHTNCQQARLRKSSISPMRLCSQTWLAWGLPSRRALLAEWTSDNQACLDKAVQTYLLAYPNAGLSFTAGYLRCTGILFSWDRLRACLKTHKVTKAAGDIIQDQYAAAVQGSERTYRVAGPNSLWHHDGQHGLVKHGIVIHAFIDGYSRQLLAIKPNTNNKATTVSQLFETAVETYGWPSRIRGDRGGENVLVAEMITRARGEGRSSYIWGPSTANTRIERAWRDMTYFVGQAWWDFFENQLPAYGYDKHREEHRWLIHHLYLAEIAQELEAWRRVWNKRAIRTAENMSPDQLYFLGMVSSGLRGGLCTIEDAGATVDEQLYGAGGDDEPEDASYREDSAVLAFMQVRQHVDVDDSLIGEDLALQCREHMSMALISRLERWIDGLAVLQAVQTVTAGR